MRNQETVLSRAGESGVMVFTDTGTQEDLSYKAMKLSIPVWKFGNGGA